MPFLIGFVIAVVVIGAIVILFNLRAIRAEAEAEQQRGAGAGSAANVGDDATAIPANPAESAQGVAGREVAGAGRSPFASSSRASATRLPDIGKADPAAGSISAPPDVPDVPQMTDDEYRAAIRAMATADNENVRPEADAVAAQELASDDAVYRAGLRELGRPKADGTVIQGADERPGTNGSSGE